LEREAREISAGCRNLRGCGRGHPFWRGALSSAGRRLGENTRPEPANIFKIGSQYLGHAPRLCDAADGTVRRIAIEDL